EQQQGHEQEQARQPFSVDGQQRERRGAGAARDAAAGDVPDGGPGAAVADAPGEQGAAAGELGLRAGVRVHGGAGVWAPDVHGGAAGEPGRHAVGVDDRPGVSAAQHPGLRGLYVLHNMHWDQPRARKEGVLQRRPRGRRGARRAPVCHGPPARPRRRAGDPAARSAALPGPPLLRRRAARRRLRDPVHGLPRRPRRPPRRAHMAHPVAPPPPLCRPLHPPHCLHPVARRVRLPRPRPHQRVLRRALRNHRCRALPPWDRRGLHCSQAL
ncbi:hypothetical protein IWQ56_001969, partial [Coemansia nantahalensis]